MHLALSQSPFSLHTQPDAPGHFPWLSLLMTSDALSFSDAVSDGTAVSTVASDGALPKSEIDNSTVITSDSASGDPPLPAVPEQWAALNVAAPRAKILATRSFRWLDVRMIEPNAHEGLRYHGVSSRISQVRSMPLGLKVWCVEPKLVLDSPQYCENC